MKRSIKNLTNFEKFEKELLKNKKFRIKAQELEYEYLLAKNIIELRRKRNLSQFELARKVGTKQPVISRIETGTVKPTISFLGRLAKAFNTHLEIRFVK